MSGLLAALTFLTRVPVPRREAFAPGTLSRAAPWFPVVGALVGLVLGATRLVAEPVVGTEAATVLGLIAATLVAGGLHEDGLADTADAFGAHVAPERRLEIMRDPRIGTYGMLAVVLVTLLAWSLLVRLDVVQCLVAAAAGHAVGRWAMLVHAKGSAPAREGGLGRRFAVGWGALVVGTIATATIVAAAAGVLIGAAPGLLATVIALVAGLAVALLVSVAAHRAVGGSTGDTHGATGKLAEVAVYAVIVALAGD